MALKVYMTRGLPGSGKSTWARNQIDENPGQYIVVTKDDLRAMMHNGKHSSYREEEVKMTRDSIVEMALERGKSPIVCDTGFHPSHEERLSEIASERDAGFEVVDFTDVPLETCIERDLRRPESVGRKVIERMYRKYLSEEKEPSYREPNGNPPAVLCDLDGTLARFPGENPYERDFLSDEPHEPVIGLLRDLDTTNYIYIVSGRNGEFEGQTREWLEIHDVPFDRLIMREEGDNRKDSVVKSEILEEILKSHDPRLVIDDRDSMVSFWREEAGIPCFQAWPGPF